MATFYKYQERDVDSQVNWADIGSGISNLVTDQLAERKAKKEAYDDQVRAFNQYLDEHPRGDSKNATEWTASYASKMTQQMLANQRAFKNGRVSERDNVVFMQNVQNGTKTMFDLSTEYQAEFADKMARRNSKDPTNRSQELEGVIMEDFEGWANFKGTTPNIDPKTGLVVLSRKDKDGKFENVSAADLFTRIKQKVNYFDIDAVTTDMETKFGENIISAVTKISKRGSQGEQISVEDKRTKDDFEKGLGTMIDSYLGDIYNTSSILTNSIITTNYEYTYDPEKAEKDSSLILLTKKDGVIAPDFSTTNGKEQIEVAKETMKTMFLAKIDYKKEVDVTSAIADKDNTQALIYGATIKEQKETATLIALNLKKALSGTTKQERQEGLNYLRAINSNNSQLDFNTLGNIVTQTGTIAQEFSVKDGNLPQNRYISTIAESILNSIGTPIGNQTQIIKELNNIGGKNIRATIPNENMSGGTVKNINTGRAVNVPVGTPGATNGWKSVFGIDSPAP